jgi:DNA repair protein RecO (recombination protein O)
MSRVYSAQAVVLRRHNLAETDKIVTLFTREHGKLQAVAKGARRPQSRIAGATEPPTFVKAFMAVGQNLDIVTQCEVKEPFGSLRADLTRLSFCNYLLEFTDALLEERLPQPDLFDLLLASLYLLNGGAEPLPLVAAFSLHAAEDAGFGPSFSRCAGCREEIAGAVAGYSVRLGGVLCRVCRPSVKDAIRFPTPARDMALQLLRSDLPTVARAEWDSKLALGLTRILRRHIEFRAERKLKSAEFLESQLLRERTEREEDEAVDLKPNPLP